jgi:hypothetical protein
VLGVLLSPWEPRIKVRVTPPHHVQLLQTSTLNVHTYFSLLSKYRWSGIYNFATEARNPKMAPRRGELTQESTLAGLQFNEPLSWRAGKAIPTGMLLQRLDMLSNELREMDQEETDKVSLTAVAKELVGPNLLNHKDKGVRAFTACCLVDILKLCAPDAPFTGTQLKVAYSTRI